MIVEGTNFIHSSGAASTVYTTMKGPITGWGEIQLTDQGGIWFTSANNTFTGTLRMTKEHPTYGVEIRIGDGANCSWAGSEIIQPDLTNHVFSVNCNSNFTLKAALSSKGGRVTKYGRGTLTFEQPFARQPSASRPDCPVLCIGGGAADCGRVEGRTAAAYSCAGGFDRRLRRYGRCAGVPSRRGLSWIVPS